MYYRRSVTLDLAGSAELALIPQAAGRLTRLRVILSAPDGTALTAAAAATVMVGQQLLADDDGGGAPPPQTPTGLAGTIIDTAPGLTVDSNSPIRVTVSTAAPAAAQLLADVEEAARG